MELLRFITAGSVDDGKSTLIGRLLYDTKSIFDDQLQAIEEASSRNGSDEVNLALLTDGFRLAGRLATGKEERQDQQEGQNAFFIHIMQIY